MGLWYDVVTGTLLGTEYYISYIKKKKKNALAS